MEKIKFYCAFFAVWAIVTLFLALIGTIITPTVVSFSYSFGKISGKMLFLALGIALTLRPRINRIIRRENCGKNDSIYSFIGYILIGLGLFNIVIYCLNLFAMT